MKKPAQTKTKREPLVMTSDSEKLDNINEKLDLILRHYKLSKDRETLVEDVEPSLKEYELFATDELKIGKGTIKNQLSAIRTYLLFSSGKVNQQTVKDFLCVNESVEWKSNQLKALRRFLRDFLQCGSWINEFKFAKTRAKIKTRNIPSDQEIALFCSKLPYLVQMVFLILYTSGLRVGEVLSLKPPDIDFTSNMIDASSIHKGETKSAWLSFITQQVADYLESYIKSELFNNNDVKLFDASYNYVQECFKNTSELTGIDIKPHFLRTIHAEKCTQAGIEEKYIDALQGRTPGKVLRLNYTVYSPESMRSQYDKVEPLLKLPFTENE